MSLHLCFDGFRTGCTKLMTLLLMSMSFKQRTKKECDSRQCYSYLSTEVCCVMFFSYSFGSLEFGGFGGSCGEEAHTEAFS